MARWILILAGLAGLATAAAAEPVDLGKAMERCAAVRDPEQRLACFDRLVERPPVDVAAAEAETPPPAREAVVSRMNLFWELDDQTHSGRGRIRPFKPLLAVPVRWSDNPNEQPASPTGQAVDAFPLDSIEAFFRLSLRTKLWDNPIGDNGDIWFAYTQTAYWQAYNSSESSPFRETNYMPEIFSVWRVGVPISEHWRWGMVSLGLKHQSNGRGSVLVGHAAN